MHHIAPSLVCSVQRTLIECFPKKITHIGALKIYKCTFNIFYLGVQKTTNNLGDLNDCAKPSASLADVAQVPEVANLNGIYQKANETRF